MTCSEGSPETQDRVPGWWAKFPISLRAIISGLLIALPAANVWPLLLRKLGVPVAATAEKTGGQIRWPRDGTSSGERDFCCEWPVTVRAA
jgi:hypothetical protein